jgi:hypothetical protein
MQNAIEHFMWGYQRHFRFALRREVERILDAIKPGLCPEVFLIGVRAVSDRGAKPACVEPEVHHWAKSEVFMKSSRTLMLLSDRILNPRCSILIQMPKRIIRGSYFGGPCVKQSYVG